ncbi:hypothetical protein G7017_03885 [Pseudomonas fulva]|uniref:hypothetical protein n=1 Tax=Pseudomonas TaxID=286 RepID=UPI0015E2FC48|nr:MULTISPECIES: hypothetical protein [Pseudomonas]MBA1220044.1 hypothetical protein [Pseudomonas fulva]MDG9889243.1 hypothetical protein [Pseudomonas juntendi]
MKTFFKSVQSALKKTRQTASKVEVKINEFDNKYTDPIGAVLASTIWNIIRVAVLPFFSALILAFVIKLTFSYGLNVQSFFVYLAVLALAGSFGIVSLMLNVVRGELRYCREREQARGLSFFSFVETSRFLTNATFNQHPEFRSALDLYLNKSPGKVLGRYTMSFFVVPTVVYALALLPLMLGLGGLHMSLPAVAVIVAVGALAVGVQNARINTHSDPAYFLMSAYRHEDVRAKILNAKK